MKNKTFITPPHLKHFKWILACFLIACEVEKDQNPLPQEEQQRLDQTSTNPSDMIQLIKQLENPYSVTNMQIAKDSLVAQGRAEEGDIEVEPTHYYVKFKPLDEAELDVLNSDSTLILYSYPMDYEIAEGGSYYHDPEVPLDQPTPQYCAVEVSYEFPSHVEYEILEELYLPEELDEEANGRILDRTTMVALVNESMRLTNNLDDMLIDGNGRTEGGSHYAQGSVLVWDDKIGTTNYEIREIIGWEDIPCGSDGGDNYSAMPSGMPQPTDDCRKPIYNFRDTLYQGSFVPVFDLEVRAKRWFSTKIGYTDPNGNFFINDDFENKFDYSIRWEKYHFSIRSGNFGQAELGGPQNTTGRWDVKLGHAYARVVNDKQQYYALIFQAARDYFYGNRFGLHSPPRNSTTSPQIKFAAHLDDKNKDSHAAIYMRYTFVGGLELGTLLNQLPSIYIREYGLSSDRVYGTTAHELAHWAHWHLDKGTFVNIVLDAQNLNLNQYGPQNDSEAVIESWAEGVEWKFVDERYRVQFNQPNYFYIGNNQWKRINNIQENNDLIYTSLVIDLMDACNQRTTSCWPDNTSFTGSDFPNDNVDSYTIKEVENALKGARYWYEWNQRMANTPNSTSNHVNDLFLNWHN